MYKVTIKVLDSGKKAPKEQIFQLDPMETGNYHNQMNDISDYLYELDIPFDVDADGDMVIDDLLMTISEQETFDQTLKTKKASYIVKGEVV